ncbi:MBL fold metallo-hydrolase [Enterococcus sp. BWR-S5]|uniref:MBL fold metallo-hydrolase n=1 Tax=Enterococcus sp. BWR-S5 TaxID=2787714 RepID=UPI0019219E44|nr:MBL fold metallo-hydrolase [Enterococcus sp. BWR-S5]MBL1227581.1 MBL fold metallo-hydrolase [Enterococcus sp. BWR-S5]
MQIRKGLYLLSGGPYGKLGNAYAVKHNEGYLLIDSSNPGALKTILGNLDYWGISEDKITHVLLTHGHDDHAGCAAYFQEKGAKVIVGSEDTEMMAQGDFGVESPYTNHVMPPCKVDDVFTQDTQLEIGGLNIQVYTMPGHTDGSVVFYVQLDMDYVLFSGDMFFPDGETGNVASTGWKGDMNYNGVKLGESFAKLWRLNLMPTVIVGGHGIPRVGNDAKESIKLAYKYYLLNNR